MFIYAALMIGFALLGIVVCEHKPTKTKTIIFLALSTLLLVVVSSLRAEGVGLDYRDYAVYFQQVRMEGFSAVKSGGFEMGFNFLTYLISYLTSSTEVYMGILALLINGLTAVAAYKYSRSPWLSMYIFLTCGCFINSLSFVRQQIAITVLLFAVEFIKNKKIIPFLLIALLAATFHSSALIVVPAYLFTNLPLNKKTAIFYGSLTAFILIFSVPIIGYITQFVYQGYAPGSEWMQSRNTNTAFIPIVMFVFVALFQKKLLERDPKNISMINYSLFGCLLFILTLKHFVFQRLALYFFSIAAIFIVPEIIACLAVGPEQLAKLASLENTNRKQFVDYKAKLKDQKNLYYTAIGFALFFGGFYFMWLLTANRLGVVPYTFFWKA